MKFKYLQTNSVVSIKHKQSDSPVWSDLLKIKEIYLQGRKLKVNNGASTLVWRDTCLYNDPYVLDPLICLNFVIRKTFMSPSWSVAWLLFPFVDGSLLSWAIVAPGFKNKTRYTPYVSPGSQISHIATNMGPRPLVIIYSILVIIYSILVQGRSWPWARLIYQFYNLQRLYTFTVSHDLPFRPR